MTTTTIPEYVAPWAGLSLEYHGSYPQAARIAMAEGHRSGSHAWWVRIREIIDYWQESGQLT